MSEPLRILVVCTFNRTRSVLIGALLHEALARRGQTATITTAGFSEVGMPPTPEAVAALASRGIDVSGHRSERSTDVMVDDADLIIAAERLHVVRLSADRVDVFERAFTLPELVGLLNTRGQGESTALHAWLDEIATARSAAGYLTTYVPEVADPTGLSELAFASAVAEIEQWCGQLADALAASGG